MYRYSTIPADGVTVAVLTIFASGAATVVPEIRNLSELLAAIDGIVMPAPVIRAWVKVVGQVAVPLATAQVIELNDVKPVGNASLSSAAVAVDGPLLVITTV